MTAGPVSGNGYASIAKDLERRIGDGEFVAGSRMPSEAALADEYQVSRGRIRTALASLARRGLVVSRPNAGWRVQARDQVQTFDRMRSFAQWAQEHGREPGGRVVLREFRPADARDARLLRVRLGDPVLRFTRIRTLDGRVVMLERSTWAPWVAPIVELMGDDVVSMTQTLAAAGIVVVEGDHRIEAVAASSEDARLLEVRRSSALLQVGRTMFTQEGRIVEFGVDRYLPNVIAFDVTAGGGQQAGT